MQWGGPRDSTAPMPCPDASVSRTKGLLKSGRASTGAPVNADLSWSKDCWACTDQEKSLMFFAALLRGLR